MGMYVCTLYYKVLPFLLHVPAGELVLDDDNTIGV